MTQRTHVGLLAGALWLSVLGRPGAVSAQEPAPAPKNASEDIRWVVTGSPHVDLWYHGLGVVGFEGIGPLPLYDPEYPGRIRAARAESGSPASSLEVNRERFATAFARDSLFEFLHFVPLYFAFSNRLAMWDALRTVTSGGDPRSVSDPTARFGANATAYVLGEGDRLAIVGEFVDVLEDEWDGFFADHRLRMISGQRDRLASLQSRWNEDVAPALAPYLRSVYLDRGVLLLSPALGFEGRVFQGEPQNREDNVVVVRMAGSADEPDGELYAAVRELCFPLVRSVIDESLGSPVGRYEGERRSSFGAVRCGSLLLQRYAPELASAYERHFLSTSDDPSPASEADFRRRFAQEFPLADDFADALTEAVALLPDR